MLPVIVLIGRPNVGKSTIFNFLTNTRNSIVTKYPNATRDSKYGKLHYNGKEFIVIDTAGINAVRYNKSDSVFAKTINSIKNSNIIFFIVDAQTGLVSLDVIILELLRNYNKPIYLIVNKINKLNSDIVITDFYSLGINNIFTLKTLTFNNIDLLLKKLVSIFYTDNIKNSSNLSLPINNNSNLLLINNKKNVLSNSRVISNNIKIAIIGRTNVGKSTLLNCILREDRVVVSKIPGTTHDSISFFINKNGVKYEFIDTAGIDKKWKYNRKNEKIFVLKTFREIQTANIILIVISANDGILHQDLILLNYAIKFGRSIIIVINKIDSILLRDLAIVKKMFFDKLRFIDFAKINFISALHGKGIIKLFQSIKITHNSLLKTISTNMLTRILHMAEQDHPPPIINYRRPKIKYAHAGGYNPFILIIHGNRLNNLPNFYKRYLLNYFRKKLKFIGICMRIQFIENKNPYLH